jgi:hypothetical protein
MLNQSGQCPFLVPVVADQLWMYPVPAYCRRPGAPVKVPALETLVRVCTTGEHARCPGSRRNDSFASGDDAEGSS